MAVTSGILWSLVTTVWLFAAGLLAATLRLLAATLRLLTAAVRLLTSLGWLRSATATACTTLLSTSSARWLSTLSGLSAGSVLARAARLLRAALLAALLGSVSRR